MIAQFHEGLLGTAGGETPKEYSLDASHLRLYQAFEEKGCRGYASSKDGLLSTLVLALYLTKGSEVVYIVTPQQRVPEVLSAIKEMARYLIRRRRRDIAGISAIKKAVEGLRLLIDVGVREPQRWVTWGYTEGLPAWAIGRVLK